MPKALILGGATGLLGKAVAAHFSNDRGWVVETLGRENGDLFDPGFLKRALDDSKPDILVNTVAWTQVDDAEDHAPEAWNVNAAFPAQLGRLLAGTEIYLIHISTDFIFDTCTKTPLTETDPVRPASVYGRTKLAGELAVLSLLPGQAAVCRTAWLFGPGRKNFVDTIVKAAATRPALTVVDDQTGSPTFTEDLACFLGALAEKRMTGIWHTVNSGSATWYELAKEAVALSGLACTVTPIPSDAWPQKAKRPAYSVLDNSKLGDFLGRKPRSWQDALRTYLA